jgi:hypothetical protein
MDERRTAAGRLTITIQLIPPYERKDLSVKKQQLHFIQMLLSYAVVNKKFRKALIKAVDASPSTVQVELSADDAKAIKTVIADLERFSKRTNLDPDDAKSWAIGITEIRDLANKAKPRPKGG